MKRSRGEDLLGLLENQKKISRPQLVLPENPAGKYASIDFSNLHIIGHDGQEYKVLGPLGIPGAFGVGWKAEKLVSMGTIHEVNEVVKESRDFLLEIVTNLINECREDSESTVQSAVAAFKGKLITWKESNLVDEIGSDLKRKARDQIFGLCEGYCEKSGFGRSGVCFPSIPQLESNMKDFCNMIKQERVDCNESVFLKTFFIPSRRKPGISDDDFAMYVQKELDCVSSIIRHRFCHENVAAVHDVIERADVIDPSSRELLGSTVCVVQELVEGGIDLFEWVEDNIQAHKKKIASQAAAVSESVPESVPVAALRNPSVARHFFRQLMSAVAAMHAKGIFHYDIKIENIMVSSSTKAIKLIDFGLSKVTQDGEVAGSRKLSIAAPCVDYLAPEVRGAREGKQTVPGAADIWCCGIVLLQLISPISIDPVRTSMKEFVEQLNTDNDKALLARFYPEQHSDGPALRDLLHRYSSLQPILKIL